MAESATPIRNVAVPGIAHNQVDVDITATQIVAGRIGRRTILIINHSSVDVYLGFDNTVTALTGLLLTGTKGTGINIPTETAVFGIAASGAPRVSYMELFGK